MESALKDGFEKNEWVRACTDLVAQSVASVPWRVSMFHDDEAKDRFFWELDGVPPLQRMDFMISQHYAQKRKFWREKRAHLTPHPNHPIEQLIKKPNIYQDRFDLMEGLVMHLILAGNALFKKARGNVEGARGVPVALWPVMPSKTKPKSEGKVWLKHYEYNPTGRRRDVEKIRPEDMLHLHYTNPGNPIWGASPLMSAGRSIDVDVAQQAWQKVSMDNRSVGDGIIGIQDYLDDEQYQDVRQRAQEEFGGIQNARRPLIIDGIVKWFDLSKTPVEMDFINSRVMNRRSICAVLHVDERMLGFFENATQQEFVTRNFWINGIIPLLERIQMAFNFSLAPEFPGNHYVWYDTSNVQALAETIHTAVRTVKILATMGYAPDDLNERFDLGLPYGRPGMNIGWVAAGSIPVTAALNNTPGDPGDPGNPTTPEDGGPQVEPGKPQEPNKPDPEDEGRPEGERQSDPVLAQVHYGQAVWDYQDCEDRLHQNYNSEFLYYGETANHYWFTLMHPPHPTDTEAADKDDSGIIFETQNGDPQLGFYHGKRNQQRFESALTRMRGAEPVSG